MIDHLATPFDLLRIPAYGVSIILFTLLAVNKWKLSRVWFAVLLLQALIYLYQMSMLTHLALRSLPSSLPPAYTGLILVQAVFLSVFCWQYFHAHKKGI